MLKAIILLIPKMSCKVQYMMDRYVEKFRGKLKNYIIKLR